MSDTRKKYSEIMKDPMKVIHGEDYSEPFDFFKGILGLPTGNEKHEQAALIKEQIDAYKQQTELARKELEDTRKQKDVEKRKINEKQIRQLRGNYRPAGGFLNQQGLSAPQDTSMSGLPTKLGA